MESQLQHSQSVYRVSSKIQGVIAISKQLLSQSILETLMRNLPVKILQQVQPLVVFCGIQQTEVLFRLFKVPAGQH
jgi:hypothetical protein